MYLRSRNLQNRIINMPNEIADEHNSNAFRKGLSADDVVNYYSQWALDSEKGTYDEDLEESRYKGPAITAKIVHKYFHGNKSARILDVAAGTGFVGEKLQELGFYNIDALEPSEGMVKIAQSKNVYVHVIQEFMSDIKTDIEDDAYDCLTNSGGMGEGHIPVSALKEMVRIVKPGGYIIIVMREEYLVIVDEYRDHLELLMARMEDQGQWSRQERTIFENHFLDKNGIAFVYKVL